MDTIILILLILVAFAITLIITKYNKIIRLQNRVKNAESGIDICLKQRFDLIPSLTECVKGYAKHEKTLLENVAKQRATYFQNQSLKNASELNNSLNRILAVAESYPKLKANEQFLNLQNSLIEIEDELQEARRIYNMYVEMYNSTIQTVPNNIVANMFGFKEKEFFQIEEFNKENIKIDGNSL